MQRIVAAWRACSTLNLNPRHCLSFLRAKHLAHHFVMMQRMMDRLEGMQYAQPESQTLSVLPPCKHLAHHFVIMQRIVDRLEGMQAVRQQQRQQDEQTYGNVALLQLVSELTMRVQALEQQQAQDKVWCTRDGADM